jgi:hypothetical protein
LLSSCLEAWLKYRPSVDRAALVIDTMAVPADPENPEMNSMGTVVSPGLSRGRHMSKQLHKGRFTGRSNLGGRHRERCIPTGGCLPMERLQQSMSDVLICTMNDKRGYVISYYIHRPYVPALTASTSLGARWYSRSPYRQRSVRQRWRNALFERWVVDGLVQELIACKGELESGSQASTGTGQEGRYAVVRDSQKRSE